MINLNEFMAAPAKSADSISTTQAKASSPATESSAANTSGSGSTLEIPRNLNLQLNTDIQTILFDKLT